MNKTAAISGVTGQLGSYLAELLLAKNYKVIGLKRRTSTNNSTYRIDHLLNNENFELKYVDINDVSSLYQLFNNNKIDLCFHMAAQSHVRISFDLPEETLKTNVLGTLNILNAIKECSPETKLLHMASSEMFGNNPNTPYYENSEFAPVSPYGISKVAAYQLVRNYRKSYNLFLSNAIAFNYESPRRGENFASKKISLGVARIKAGFQKELVLGNLNAYRDFSFAKDIAEGCYNILQLKEPEDLILSSGETYSIRSYLEETFNAAGFNQNEWKKYVRINPIYFRPQEVDFLLGSSNKAKSLIDWDPKVKFKELVKLMYEYEWNLLNDRKF